MDVPRPIIIHVKPVPGSEPLSDAEDADCLEEEELVELETSPAPPQHCSSVEETAPVHLGNGVIPTVASQSTVSSPQLDTEEVSRTLEWFRETLTRLSKHGRVTLKDFKSAARECEGFAESLFKLFDTDCSESVSLQELVGGLGRLTVKGRKRKILKWFEHTFAHVSGDDQLLQLDEFKRALHISGFVERVFQLMDHENTGKLTIPEILDAFGKLTCMDRDAKWLAWFEQQFSMMAGSDRQIDLEEFKHALNVKQSFFAERFFHLFDKDGSGTISLKELMDGLTLLTNGTEVDKLKFLFEVYDVDGNGHIDFNELRTVLKSCMNESALKFSDDKLDELTRALFEDADVDKSGTINFEELKAELSKHPGVVENLTISAANWLKPPARRSQKTWSDYIPAWLRWKYIRNNLPYFIFCLIYAVLNIVLFVEAAVRHRDKGVFVSIARGCGQCLNFNPVVVVFLMMRRGLTWLRSTRLATFLPLDQHIELHKLVGFVIFVFSTIHVLAHLSNFTRLEVTGEGNFSMWEYLFSVHTGLGWVGGAAGLTGDLLYIILIILVVCSLPCVRRKGFFEIFYWTHNLFFPWFILLILHATHFWIWFILPAVLYILERILRSKLIKLARYGRTYIQKGFLLPSRVSHLVINRPTNFSYQPGDYIFIQIPVIARYEWHPFTISSAPEQSGFVWLHIRSVGTWTNKLYKFFEDRNKRLQRGIMQVQMPVEKPQHHDHVQALEQAMASISQEDLDKSSLMEIEDETHPLAPVHLPAPPEEEEEGTSRREPPARESVSNSSSSVFQGQNFTHMYGLYAQPIVIDVPDEDEEAKGIEVFIDGPYGTPSGDIFQAEHAVLIGAGIGVTPFASILQSIVLRYRNARQVCPRCNHGWTGYIPTSVMRLKKVDFFWINRDQHSFEWFVSLLSELEIEQSVQTGLERFIDMHMYMTSALRKTDVKAIGLQMALDLIHKKEKRDLITGLKTRTQAGRPDWDKVFQQLKNESQGKVTVFFCGSPAISTILKGKCALYGFEFRKENF